jgi:peptidyl-prolyl cis-trans isomerase SurA
VTEKRTQQILIKTNDVVTDEDARKRLRSLRQRLVSDDARFEELAQANSDDANSAGDGGDMGWVRPKSMPPNLGRVIERLAPGELSEPFRSRFGWHLVRVTDTRDKDVTEESLRQQAQQALRKRKREAELELWLRQLREEAYIEYRLSS